MSKMNRCIAAAALMICGLCTVARAASEEGMWQTDFEAAKTKAKAEKKLLLVDFTGSDWCIWCQKLRSEVFEKDEFKTEAPKQFVLVELDYPRSKKLSDDLKAQNDKLRDQYKIRGYPTVLLLDPEGQVVAHTGYQAGGPEKYVKHLAEFVELYASVVKMKQELPKAEGLDRAKLMDKLVDAYEKLGSETDDIDSYSHEIVSLDADNKAGLKVKYEFRILLAESKKLAEAHKLAEAKEAIEKALALEGIGASQKQEAYMAEGNLSFAKQDFAGVIACLNQAVAADPDSELGSQAKKMIERFKSLAEAQEAIAKLKGELDKTEGIDRAKLLDKLLDAQSKMPMMSLESLQETQKWTKEIIALDPDNKAGLKTKYELRNMMSKATLQIRTNKLAEARTTLEEAAALPGLSDEQKTKIEHLRKLLPKEKDKEADTDK